MKIYSFESLPGASARPISREKTSSPPIRVEPSVRGDGLDLAQPPVLFPMMPFSIQPTTPKFEDAPTAKEMSIEEARAVYYKTMAGLGVSSLQPRPRQTVDLEQGENDNLGWQLSDRRPGSHSDSDSIYSPSPSQPASSSGSSRSDLNTARSIFMEEPETQSSFQGGGGSCGGGGASGSW